MALLRPAGLSMDRDGRVYGADRGSQRRLRCGKGAELVARSPAGSAADVLDGITDLPRTHHCHCGAAFRASAGGGADGASCAGTTLAAASPLRHPGDIYGGGGVAVLLGAEPEAAFSRDAARSRG